ncbi:MAG TPA: hypothetical protein VGU26_00510 [Gaiellaceae bacterium]|nr:hypothetical protein [Gaiellaceae bacterium]
MRPRERLLVFLGVCLPVPVLAATGLSVPLPASVERVATELVPFAHQTTVPEGGVAAGAIVLTEAERRQERPSHAVSHTRVEAAPAAASPARELTQRRTERPAGRRVGAPHRNDTHPVPEGGLIAPGPAPVAVPVIPPEDTEDEDRHEAKPKPKPTPRPTHEPKPKREPKPKPKHEPEQQEKPKHKPDEPKPEPRPKPKHDAGDEPPPQSSEETPEKDNGPGAGKPSESERRQSR